MHRTLISLFFLLFFNTQLFASDLSESLRKQVDYADSLAKKTLLKDADAVYNLVLNELKKSETLNSGFGIKVLQKKATYLEQDNKHEEAISILLEILDLSKEDNYPDLYGKVYLDLALIHEKIGDFATCKDYLGRAAKMFIEGNINDSLYSYHCIRWASYYRLIGIEDSAIKYAELAIENLKGTKPKDLAESYLIVGLTMSNADPDRAIENYTLAKKQMALYEDKVSIGFMNLNIANLYLKQGDFIKSMIFCDSAYAIMQETKDSSLEEYVYRSKMNIYSSRKLFDSAFHYAQLYYKSSLRNAESVEKEKIIEIQEKYQNDLNQELISIQEEKNYKQKILLYLLSTIGVALLILLFLFFKLNQRLNTEKALNREYIKSLEKGTELLNASLKKQDILLAEVHHRINNNWQIIYNILELQSDSTTSLEFKKLTQESQNRIKAMSNIHNRVYQSNDYSQIKMQDYLDNLVQSICESMRYSSCEVLCKVNANRNVLHIDKAIPLGLIVVELVSNCFKHAFTGKAKGEVNVDLIEIDNIFRLTVWDNGVGFPLELTNQGGLGLEIVQGLVRQIDGELKIVREDFTTILITFKS